MAFHYAGRVVIPITALAADFSVNVNKQLSLNLIEKLFKKRKIIVDSETTNETFKNLQKPININFNNAEFGKSDWVLKQNLRYNAATFAAFKNHNEIAEIQSLLIDENGNVRKWTDFRNKALQVSDKYNKRWLQTEHNHAVQSSRMARKWQDFQADADLYPNLMYVAVRDERTRQSHAALHGAIYPINHSFWDTHLPPNYWGCRCSVRQTDEEPIEKQPLELPADFCNNAGKTGMLFSEEHLYFKTPNKAQKAFIQNAVGKIIKPPEQVIKAFDDYNNFSKEFSREGFNFDNGGFNVYHKLHQFHKIGGIAEKKAGKLLMNNNAKQVIFNQEQGDFVPKADLTFDNKQWDIKWIDNANEATIRKYIDRNKNKTNCFIFYFENKEQQKNLRKAIVRTIGKYAKNKNSIKLPEFYVFEANGNLKEMK